MFAKLLHRVMAAVVVLGATAVVARITYELLAPLAPLLIVAAALGVIYALIFGPFRR